MSTPSKVSAVHVTNVAKTVADCFEVSEQDRLDIAIEALKECQRRNPHGRAQVYTRGPSPLAASAEVDRVMQPYLGRFLADASPVIIPPRFGAMLNLTRSGRREWSCRPSLQEVRDLLSTFLLPLVPNTISVFVVLQSGFRWWVED